jgi:membrane fusion protein (multidrug efflux system)
VTTTASLADVADEKADAKSEPKKARRTPLLLGGLVAAALLGSGIVYLATRGQESTDDAQVEGRVMNVAPRVTGMVLHVKVQDNQRVEPGDVLVELDPADYQVKLDAARADLAAAKAAVEGAAATLDITRKTAPASLRQARGGVTSASSAFGMAQASIDQAKADLAAAESKQKLAELNFHRSSALVHDQAVAQVDLDTRQTELDAAAAATDQARARLVSAQASLAGSGGGVVLAQGRLEAAETAADQVSSAQAALDLAKARVQQMEANVAAAELNLSYTQLRATRSGVVSRRTVEEGQTVSPDRVLFAIVPQDDVWVVANFKEDQLAEVKPGQPATVRLDTYGRRTLKGHVESLAGGTGARFALLPPDNATGNFVKVVQRVPVLVRIDDASGLDLRPGMSADVTVITASGR